MISMGGTFIRLVDQGHDVHVAYQTSGNTAVWDDDVLRFVEFAIDFNESIGEDNARLKSIYEDMRNFIPTKKPNQVDTKEIRDVKGFIRKRKPSPGQGMQDCPTATSILWHCLFMRREKQKRTRQGKKTSGSRWSC